LTTTWNRSNSTCTSIERCAYFCSSAEGNWPNPTPLTFHQPSRSFSLSEHTYQEAAQEGRRVS
jgi:hypothetical protein